MQPDDTAIAELAAAHNTTSLAAHAAIVRWQVQAGGVDFYIFWTSGTGGPTAAPRRTRTVVAFPTPHSALAFAQRNNLGSETDRPRLRRLNLAQLLLALTREPTIERLILVPEGAAFLPGQIPTGLILDRAMLMRELSHQEDVT